LISLGYQKGDRIAAYGRNSDAYVLLMLGCFRAGVIHVPINFGLSGDELLYVLQQSGARALFHDALATPNVEAVLPQLDLQNVGVFCEAGELSVLAVARSNESSELPDVDLGSADLAQFIYTSGTTSRPKGVMMEHGALLNNARIAIQYFNYSEQTRAISALPFYHAVMHVNCLPYLLAGATQFVLERPDPLQLLELIQAEHINSLFAPPTVLIKLLREPQFDSYRVDSLAQILYGASIMPKATVEELKVRVPKAGLFNIYGQTEIGPIATVLFPHEHEERPTSAGRPVFNTETRIVDEQMRDVAVGEVGEIVHRSPSLLRGYWNKPEETAEAFAGGWFHSGDLGLRDAGGYLYVVDRVKDVINTGGVLVSSREVEECLYGYDTVAECAVISLPHPKWVEAIAAVVVLKAGMSTSGGALIEHTQKHLAHFKLPKRVVFVEAMPINPSGKILKRELRESFKTLFDKDF
jgi:fatty-acyl-CoA synthase